jgi:hypothetical protein
LPSVIDDTTESTPQPEYRSFKVQPDVPDSRKIKDQIEFDDVNIMHYDGMVAVIHRDVMKHCMRDGLWYRVAHAAGWIAETGSMLDALEETLAARTAVPRRPAIHGICPIVPLS